MELLHLAHQPRVVVVLPVLGLLAGDVLERQPAVDHVRRRQELEQRGALGHALEAALRSRPAVLVLLLNKPQFAPESRDQLRRRGAEHLPHRVLEHVVHASPRPCPCSLL